MSARVAAPATTAMTQRDAPARYWARSGLMALTGPADAAPLVPEFDVMAGIESLLARLEDSAARCGRDLHGDLRWFTERAALQGLTRRGQVSCNGSCRLIAARDGWIAVNLPRAADLDCVPAFVGAREDEEPWSAIETRARTLSCAELVETGRLLGLAVAEARVPSNDRAAAPWTGDVAPLLRLGAARPVVPRDGSRDPPLVIDLTALWAGPSSRPSARGGRCARDQGREPRPARPGARGPARDVLPANGGKESVVLDFTRASDLERLRGLVAQADLVIGSARPRAFEQLGLAPEALIAQCTGLTWVAITACGWTGDARNAVGFGDDAAAAGGLLAEDATGQPVFLGDALGRIRSRASLRRPAHSRRWRRAAVCSSMQRSAAPRLSSRRAGVWTPANAGASIGAMVTGGCRSTVTASAFAAPGARPLQALARDSGADTERVLAEFAATHSRGPAAV